MSTAFVPVGVLSAGLALGTALVPACAAVAQSLGADATSPAPAFSDGRVILFPGGDVYPAYVADPHRPTSALAASSTPASPWTPRTASAPGSPPAAFGLWMDL